jgi:hypothetical protein
VFLFIVNDNSTDYCASMFNDSWSQWLATLSCLHSAKVKDDWLSVIQPVLVSSTHLGSMTRFLLLSDSYGCVDVGHPIWWEEVSVFSIVAGLHQCSYFWVQVPQDSRLPQPGGLSPRIYFSQEQISQSHIITDGQTASLPRCQESIWDPHPIFLLLLLNYL